MSYKVRIEFKDGQVFEPKYASEAFAIAEIKAETYGLSRERVLELVKITHEIYLKNEYLRVIEDVVWAVLEYQDLINIENFWDFYDKIVERAFELGN